MQQGFAGFPLLLLESIHNCRLLHVSLWVRGVCLCYGTELSTSNSSSLMAALKVLPWEILPRPSICPWFPWLPSFGTLLTFSSPCFLCPFTLSLGLPPEIQESFALLRRAVFRLHPLHGLGPVSVPRTQAGSTGAVTCHLPSTSTSFSERLPAHQTLSVMESRPRCNLFPNVSYSTPCIPLKADGVTVFYFLKQFQHFAG